MLTKLMLCSFLVVSLNTIAIFGNLASGSLLESELGHTHGFSFGNEGMPEELNINSHMYSSSGASDAIDPSQLRAFPGYCSFQIESNAMAEELCGAVVFQNDVYGLSTGDPFESLVRQGLKGNHPFRIYRFTNSKNIEAQEYQFTFMSWHSIQDEPPKYSCKLESGCLSTPSPSEGFAAVSYNDQPTLLNDETAINDFTGSCTFEIKHTLKKEELIVAVLFEDFVYGLETLPGFDVLVRQTVQHGLHPTKTFRLTNHQLIEPSTLHVDFLSWYKDGNSIPKYTCKLETECTTPGDVHKYGF